MENILQETGQCGKFQVCHVTLVQLCRFVSAFTLSLMIFGLYNPGWRCVKFNSTSTDFVANTTSSYGTFGQTLFSGSTLLSSHSQRVLFNSTPPYLSAHAQQEQNDTYHNMDMSDSFMSASYNATCDVMDSCSMVEFNSESSTIVTEFGLICDGVWIAYLIISVLNGGMLVGALVWGQFGERFGRRACLYSSTFIMTISCGLATFSPIWEVYAFFTFFLGFGIVAILPTVSVLSMEFLTSKWRGRLLSIPVWNAGIISFALMTYLLREWKRIHMACAFLCGLACLGFFWTPESLRWLVIHGKSQEANRVVSKISRLNKKPCPSVTLNELIDSEDIENRGRHYTYLDLFRNREIRVTAFKLGLIRVVILLSYDVIGYGIKSLPGDFYTNVIIAGVIDIPFILVLSFLANRLGRRVSGVLLMSLAAVCCIAIVVSLLVLENNSVRGFLITSMALTSRSTIQASVNLHNMHATELVPTAVRNISFGYLNVLSRITGIFVPFLIPRDHPSMVACFAVLAVSQATACGVLLSLPETKGKPMTDTLQPMNAPMRRIPV